jgi:hypothetical protein
LPQREWALPLAANGENETSNRLSMLLMFSTKYWNFILEFEEIVSQNGVAEQLEKKTLT